MKKVSQKTRIDRIEYFFEQLQNPELKALIIAGIHEIRAMDSGTKKIFFVDTLEKYMEELEL